MEFGVVWLDWCGEVWLVCWFWFFVALVLILVGLTVFVDFLICGVVCLGVCLGVGLMVLCGLVCGVLIMLLFSFRVRLSFVCCLLCVRPLGLSLFIVDVLPNVLC